MSYGALLLIIIITIIIIIVAVLFTVAIDDIARLPDTSNSTNNKILDNVTSIGSIIVVIIIFIIALCLTIGILEYYSIQRGIPSNWAFYGSIILAISLIGLLILEGYLYNELNLFKSDVVITIIETARSYFLWSIGLTVISLILSFLLIAIA